MANIKRLTELLENVVPYIPPRRLRMSGWTGLHDALPNGCGTTACVAGWAGVHPAFNAQGYFLRTERPSKTSEHLPICGIEEGHFAVREFFVLTSDEQAHVFGAHHTNDPVAAACRIIDVIEANTD